MGNPCLPPAGWVRPALLCVRHWPTQVASTFVGVWKQRLSHYRQRRIALAVVAPLAAVEKVVEPVRRQVAPQQECGPDRVAAVLLKHPPNYGADGKRSPFSSFPRSVSGIVSSGAPGLQFDAVVDRSELGIPSHRPTRRHMPRQREQFVHACARNDRVRPRVPLGCRSNRNPQKGVSLAVPKCHTYQDAERYLGG